MSTSVLAWFKSSYSSADGDDCVEVAACPGVVHVRDSKEPEGPHLSFTASEWRSFVAFAVQL